jgi:tetratricopeptide (TPR) repeat protein
MDRRSHRSPLSLVVLAWLVGCGTPSSSSTPTQAAAAPPPSADAVAPASAPAELALGYVAGDGPSEQLIAAAQERVRKTPDDAEAYNELALRMIRRARETSDDGYRRYAEDALRAARGLEERNPQTMMLSAMVLQDQHRFRGALSLAREYIALRPDDPTGHLVAGDALLELGEYDPAIDAYQQAMNIHPDLRSYNRAAHMRWLMGDVTGSREIMELAIDAGSARDPESRAWCFVDLGEIDLRRGEPELALRATGAALQLVPDYWPALVLEARALHRTGRLDDAIAKLQIALDRKATAEDLLRMGEWLEQAGRHDEAKRHFDQALALAEAEPRPVALWLARTQREPEKALALAEAELAERQNIAAHDAHAMALLRLGRVAAAQAAMDRALVLQTADAELRLHAGLVASAAGDTARARTELEQARKIDAGADPKLMAELARAVGES